MDIPRWISWAGLAAIIGGVVAVVLTAPFVTAYFYAYPGHNVPPFWIHSVRSVSGSLLTFASPQVVYNAYGRIYDLVYLLFLPAAFGLHHLHFGTGSRIEKWGFGILSSGLLVSFVGVAGDYWANGAGFFIEIPGLFTLAIGSTLYGVALFAEQGHSGLVCVAACRLWADRICVRSADSNFKPPAVCIRHFAGISGGSNISVCIFLVDGGIYAFIQARYTVTNRMTECGLTLRYSEPGYAAR